MATKSTTPTQVPESLGARRLPKDFLTQLQTRIIGQPTALEEIGAIFEQWEIGMNPAGRPPGVFLLLGPTGVGKTHTIETIGDIVLGNPRAVVKVDCAEFQHSHEIAKLIGSPPGYLGHRETTALLSQSNLNRAWTEDMKLSLVLFDEIEKASDALWNLLLGILDKATLTLGDNTRVDFSRAMIFMTSNLGSREMSAHLHPAFGFTGSGESPDTPESSIDLKALETIATAAMRRKFTPEFVNRIDAVLTYRPFTRVELRLIFAQILQEVQARVFEALGEGCFLIRVSDEAREWLLDQGEVKLYGARRVKRLVEKHITRKIVSAMRGGLTRGRQEVSVVLDEGSTRILV